jgi:hypothetical protein
LDIYANALLVKSDSAAKRHGGELEFAKVSPVHAVNATVIPIPPRRRDHTVNIVICIQVVPFWSGIYIGNWAGHTNVTN